MEPRAWQDGPTDRERRSSAYERRANGRQSRKLLSLDVLSPIAVECRGDLRGYGRVSLSEELVQLLRFWGHFVGRVESCCLAQVFFQERDSRSQSWVRANGILELL